MASTATEKAMDLQSTITLKDGVKMPLFGLGTYRVTDEGSDKGIAVMAAALKHGYRMFDTAQQYGNEAEVGQAIKKSGLERKDVFVVTKALKTEHGYESTLRACKQSLERLGTGYIDLYLVHSPTMPNILETYDAMLDLQKQGIVRSVGVSNFRVAFLEELRKAGRPTPSVNQIELHGCCTKNSDPIVEYCNKHGIAVMGYSPLARGRPFNEPLVKELTEKYQRSPAQIMIRWSVQKGYITIPKTSSEQRVVENAAVFDWSLSSEDEAQLGCMPHWSLMEDRGINVLTQEWMG